MWYRVAQYLEEAYVNVFSYVRWEGKGREDIYEKLKYGCVHALD